MVLSQFRLSGKGWWTVLYGHARGFMTQMKIMRGVICGMSSLVFSSIGGYRDVALGILILFIFQVSEGVRHVLTWLWKSSLDLLRILI